MSINVTTGRISGNLTTGAGSYIIQATDRNGRVATKAITITINALPTFAWATSANLTFGYKLTESYNATLSVTGGIAPYTFSLKSGSSLPGGLSLNSTTGIIGGTPTTAGNYTFTVVARESSCDALTIEKTFTLQVYDPIAISGSPISGIKCNAITPTSFPVTGGAAPITWTTAPSPIVPSGLTINATTGVISGVVSGNAGSYPVVVKATDKNGRTSTYTSNITITDPALSWVTSANLPDGYEKTSYSTMVSVSGVTPPYQYSLTGGTLPNNLTLNGTTGVISGNLTTVGNYTFTIRAQDACGRVADRLFTLKVVKNAVLECADQLKIIIDYIHGIDSYHVCGIAKYEIYINNISIGFANLNNGNTDPGAGHPYNSDYRSKYSSFTINQTDLADRVKSAANNGQIQISFRCIYTACHSGGCGALTVEKTKSGVTTQVYPRTAFQLQTVAVTICQNSTISPPQALATVVRSALIDRYQTCIVDAKSVLANVTLQDLVTTDKLVGVPFLIGKTEVSNQEYCEFLNAVAGQSDPNSLYNAAMNTALNGGIVRSGTSGAYAYSVKSGMGNYPVVYVSWFDAARYVNWLSNGSPTGAQDKTTTEDGAYALNGAVSGAGIARNATNPNNKQEPKYWLLNEGEWYTSAYLKPSKVTSVGFWSYPTQRDSAPDLTLSDARNLANCENIFDGPTEAGFFGESYGPFGTLDQGGNVREWTESVDSGQYRIIRGGSWADSAEAMKASESDVSDPTLEDDMTGFRIGGAP